MLGGLGLRPEVQDSKRSITGAGCTVQYEGKTKVRKTEGKMIRKSKELRKRKQPLKL